MSEISKEYFRQKVGELLHALNCVNTAIAAETAASAIETRPICVEQGEGCLRAYLIVEVTSEGTVILRIETAQGTPIEDAVQTDCTCDCVDLQPAP